jgi:hypothetical protein
MVFSQHLHAVELQYVAPQRINTQNPALRQDNTRNLRVFPINGDWDAVFEDVSCETSGFGVSQRLGGKQMDFQIVSGFLLHQRNCTDAPSEVPVIEVFDENTYVNVTEFVSLSFNLRTKHIDGLDSGILRQGSYGLLHSLFNHNVEDSHLYISSVLPKTSCASSGGISFDISRISSG